MADNNQPSSSENNPPLRIPWAENASMAKRMNKCVAEWEEERDLAAKTKRDEITKKGKTLTPHKKTKKD